MLGWFAPDPTPVLEGQRVVLRAPRSRDYQAWRQLRRDSRDFLRPYEPRWTEADLNRQAFGARLLRGRQEARRGTDYSFLLFDKTGRKEILVGGLTISNVRRRAAQFATLGYWMGEEFAGKGLMTESVALLLPFFFEGLGLHRLQAAFLPHNSASRRVLEKNGFREEGYAENYLQIDGKWADHVLFALTRERWDAQRRAGGR
ncbi:MAG: GNAT family N-acetyltransferase [Hyphomicrobiales bacterium]|nr:MAG: GNAT family N-acetyltransferase [Hyphomicrobiales bacterium]